MTFVFTNFPTPYLFTSALSDNLEVTVRFEEDLKPHPCLYSVISVMLYQRYAHRLYCQNLSLDLGLTPQQGQRWLNGASLRQTKIRTAPDSHMHFLHCRADQTELAYALPVGGDLTLQTDLGCRCLKGAFLSLLGSQGCFSNRPIVKFLQPELQARFAGHLGVRDVWFLLIQRHCRYSIPVNSVSGLYLLQHVKKSQFLPPPLPSDHLCIVYLQGGRFPKTGI